MTLSTIFQLYIVARDNEIRLYMKKICCYVFKFCFPVVSEYDRDQDKCSTMLYDPTHYTLFYDCYSTLLTTRMNTLLNSTGLDCL